MFKAKEHIQTVKLPLHCVKLKLIWYNWESTCVKTPILWLIWPCSLWRLADANDGCFSSFLKTLVLSLHLHVSIICPQYYQLCIQKELHSIYACTMT